MFLCQFLEKSINSIRSYQRDSYHREITKAQLVSAFPRMPTWNLVYFGFSRKVNYLGDSFVRLCGNGMKREREMGRKRLSKFRALLRIGMSSFGSHTKIYIQAAISINAAAAALQSQKILALLSFWHESKNSPGSKLWSHAKYVLCVSKLRNSLNFSNGLLYFETAELWALNREKKEGVGGKFENVKAARLSSRQF